MKNIITNNCLGGYIYRDILKEEYQNPFIWVRLDNIDLIKLLENYETLNFKNIEIFKESKKLENFCLKIDDVVKIKCSHYVFDSKYNTPTIIGVDVHYNKIWEYIIDIYLKRLKRMQKEINYVFIEDDGTYNIDKILSILQEKKIKTFIITNKKHKFLSENLVIVPHIKYKETEPHFYKEYYRNEIKEFLELK